MRPPDSAKQKGKNNVRLARGWGGIEGLKGNLSQKTEPLTPKGKALKPLCPQNKSVAEGMGFGADKEDRTFSARKCYEQRGETIEMHWG